MDIVTMFHQRDKIFYNETKKILNSLAPVVDGATQFVDDTYGVDANRNLVWEGVNLIEGIITLVGVVSYAPGSQLMFEDELMDITEDNSEYFQQLIRVGIPIPVAANQSANEIYKYLVTVQDDAMKKKNEPNINQSDNITFNLDKLTDEQKHNLITPNKAHIH